MQHQCQAQALSSDPPSLSTRLTRLQNQIPARGNEALSFCRKRAQSTCFWPTSHGQDWHGTIRPCVELLTVRGHIGCIVHRFVIVATCMTQYATCMTQYVWLSINHADWWCADYSTLAEEDVTYMMLYLVRCSPVMLFVTAKKQYDVVMHINMLYEVPCRLTHVEANTAIKFILHHLGFAQIWSNMQRWKMLCPSTGGNFCSLDHAFGTPASHFPPNSVQMYVNGYRKLINPIGVFNSIVCCNTLYLHNL